ncbi:hypothetical protein NMG60_11033882 [Bertholletia excelsa]
MQTPKTSKNNSLEAPQKISPRAVRKPRNGMLESAPAPVLNLASRIPKDRSPKAPDHRSPRSPASEKRRPNRVAELESQISQLQEDLKMVNNQLSSSESEKQRAQQDLEESRKQLLAISSKLEESQKQLLELSASEEGRTAEFQKISQDQELAWQSKLEAVQKQRSLDSSALTSAVNEIIQLKIQLEMVAESEAELKSLKENLTNTNTLMEDMKNELRDCKESEAQAQALVNETLLQLETAKRTIETLRIEGIKAKEACNSLSVDLDWSRAHVGELEKLISELKGYKTLGDDLERDCEVTVSDENSNTMELKAELVSVKVELGQLRTALETAERRCHEEKTRSNLQITSANELLEQIKSRSSLKQTELEAELNKAKGDIEELKANLMDKETELQGISEENEDLHMKLQKSIMSQREYKLEKELKKCKEDIEDLKANLMDKETELQNITEENDLLKCRMNDQIVDEVEAAKAAEQEALMKLGYMTEEVDKSQKRAARVAEQLEAAQGVNSEMEAELRKLKVQCDQWRKAAEAAATMLSMGDSEKSMGRTRSLDTDNCNPLYSEDIDYEKKNANMLKKIGVFWKKPMK